MEFNYENRVGVWKRLVAKVVDAIFILIMAYFLIADLLLGLFKSTSIAGGLKEAMGFAIAINVSMLLYNLIEGLTGASPGKMFKKIKVAKEDGSKAGISDFMKRWVIINLPGIATLLYLALGIDIISTAGSIFSLVLFVGYFFIFGKKRQALHGKYSKTVIINK
jgi:uncharacterized RDD family membrane protein YckC|tara:strand:- start:1120 stop:1611 length:492 start_codon:yes stop_codon:yes gene_type:complete